MACAGKQGRDFAVVADEVRNLATKTSEAAVEITKLIKVLREKVELQLKQALEFFEKPTLSAEILQ